MNGKIEDVWERAEMDRDSVTMRHDYRRWGPFLAGGLVVGAILGFIVGRNGNSIRQFELSLTKQNELLADGEYGAAYDYLLASARLSPSDPRLLAAVFAFIEKAAAVDDADALFLAEDLYSRADLLIPYQPVETISDSRKQYDQLSALFEAQVPPQPDWFTDVSALVSKAADTEIALDIRSQLLDQAGRRKSTG